MKKNYFLRPCPNCSGQAEMKAEPKRAGYFVQCQCCGMRCSTVPKSKVKNQSLEIAADLWNRGVWFTGGTKKQIEKR